MEDNDRQEDTGSGFDEDGDGTPGGITVD